MSLRYTNDTRPSILLEHPAKLAVSVVRTGYQALKKFGGYTPFRLGQQ